MSSKLYIALLILVLAANTAVKPMEGPGDDREKQKNDLFKAVKEGNIDSVRSLLDNGARIDVVDSRGWQPIHSAAQYGQTAIVELLLARDASQINAATTNGSQPIHLAARQGHGAIVVLLAANGANISSNDYLQSSLNELFSCSDFSTLSTVRLTSKYEAKVTISDVFRMAAGKNRQETVQTILDHVSEHPEDNDFAEALIGAVTAGHVTIVRLLHNYMKDDETLRGLVPEVLGRVLARAAAYPRFDVIEYLMGSHKPATPLSCAGRLMQQLLNSFSPIERATNERARTYGRILRTLADRQRWESFIRPIIERSQLAADEEGALPLSPIARIPEELWACIFSFLNHSNLHDISSSDEEARSLVQSMLPTISYKALSALLLLLEEYQPSETRPTIERSQLATNEEDASPPSSIARIRAKLSAMFSSFISHSNLHDISLVQSMLPTIPSEAVTAVLLLLQKYQPSDTK